MGKAAKAYLTNSYIDSSVKMRTIEVKSKQGKPLLVLQSKDTPLAIETTLRENGWGISSWDNDTLVLNYINNTTPSSIVKSEGKPAPPEASKATSVGCLLFLAIFIGIIFASCTSSMTDGGTDPSTSPEPKAVTDIDAIVMCEEFVKRKLNAPSTAEFSQEESIQDPTDQNKFKVIGLVEAENQLGGIVGSRFRCNLTYTPETEEWLSPDTYID